MSSPWLFPFNSFPITSLSYFPSLNALCKHHPGHLSSQKIPGTSLPISFHSPPFPFPIFTLSIPTHFSCRILIPFPGTEPVPLAVKALSPSHWTTREFPTLYWSTLGLASNHRCVLSHSWTNNSDLNKIDVISLSCRSLGGALLHKVLRDPDSFQFTDLSESLQVRFLLFSRWVMSDFSWPHALQHARLPCPPLSPRVCSNSCPLSQWSHVTISSSVIPS